MDLNIQKYDYFSIIEAALKPFKEDGENFIKTLETQYVSEYALIPLKLEKEPIKE